MHSCRRAYLADVSAEQQVSSRQLIVHYVEAPLPLLNVRTCLMCPFPISCMHDSRLTNASAEQQVSPGHLVLAGVIL